MLATLDRIQLAVPNAEEAAETFAEYFESAAVREGELPHLQAHMMVIGLGDSEVELLEPTGQGPVKDFVDTWGGGLFAVGFTTPDISDMLTRITRNQAHMTVVGDRIHLEPHSITGLRAVISPVPDREAVPVGSLSHIYEVTNPVSDLQAATDYYTDLFGLDAEKFNAISSKQYGYTGTLTLFDPPKRLDRIEVTQITDYDAAMGLFHQRRGNGLYMCFAEVEDFAALRERLERSGARYGLDVPPKEGAESDVLFIHPKSLHGTFMGISQTDAAWRWSSGSTYH